MLSAPMIRCAAGPARVIACHAHAAYPEECVGLLLGHWSHTTITIQAISPVDNSANGPAHQSRFILSPEAYLDADQQAQQRGMEIVGCYHSHPDQEAIPSAHDLAGAQQAGGGSRFVYLIQSVWRGKATRLTAWYLVSDACRFQRVHHLSLV